MRAARRLPILALATLALAACAPAGPHPVRRTIRIRAFVFTPGTVKVNRGDTLVFVNDDAVPHTARQDGGGWDTGDIPANATKTVVVERRSTGPYHCAYHPTMRGALRNGD